MSFDSRFPGGGGAKINGIIKSYAAMAGEDISAGDFVRYVNDVTANSADTSLMESSYTGYVIGAVLLPDGKVFIAHSYGTSYQLYGIVVTISGTTITKGTDTLLSSTSYTGRYINTVVLPDGKVFIAHSYNTSYYLYGIVVTISGTTITAGTDTLLNSATTNTGYAISAVLLPDGKVFIAHSYGTSYYLYGMVVTISGTTITKETNTLLSNTTNTGLSVSAVLLPDGKVFIAHSYGANRYLYGIVVTISGTTITAGTDTLLSNMSDSGWMINTILLPGRRVFMAHSFNSNNHHLYGIVVTISGTTITAGTDTIITTVTAYTGHAISAVLLPDDKIFIAHSYNVSNYHLYGMVITISGTTITAGTDIPLADDSTYTGLAMSAVLLPDGKMFVAHSRADQYYRLYGMIPLKGSAFKSETLSSNIIGVAKNDKLDIYIPGTT